MSSPFFKPEEFSCNCNYDDCIESENFMDERFLELIFKIRASTDIPMVITSAYRCNRHNRQVGGVKNSYHTKGLAIDVRVTDSYQRYELVEAAIAHGLSVGVYRNFLHLELRKNNPKLFRGSY